MALTYIKIFIDSLDAIAPLDDGEQGRLFRALLTYAKTGEAPALEGNERFLFPMLRAQLDREAANYESVCRTNRANGALGGRPRKKPSGFPETEKSQDKEEDKDQDKEEEKEKDYISSGASRPRQRKNFPKGMARTPKVDPVAARADIARMEKYLKKLREEGTCGEAPQPPPGSLPAPDQGQ